MIKKILCILCLVMFSVTAFAMPSYQTQLNYDTIVVDQDSDLTNRLNIDTNIKNKLRNRNDINNNLRAKSKSDSSSRSGSSSGSSSYIVEGSEYIIKPAIPQDPDHWHESPPPPFEWHESKKEKIAKEKESIRYYNELRMKQNMMKSEGEKRVQELKKLGLNDKAAKAQVLYEQGVGDKPVIVNGKFLFYKKG